MTRKTLLIAVASLLASIPMIASNVLTINLANSEQVSCDFQDKPVITYEKKNVVIATTKETLTFAMADVVNMKYTTPTTTGIDNVASKMNIAINAGMLTVSGLAAGEIVQLYSVNGMQLASITADANGTVTADVSAGNAIVIVKTKTVTFKAQVK